MSDPTLQVRTRTLIQWGVFGQGIYLVTQFLTLVVLTRLVPVEDVGAFGLASSIVIPVFFFFSLNIRANYASGQRAGFGFYDYLGLLAVFALGGYAFIVAVAWLGFSGTPRMLMMVIGAAKVAESFSNLAYGVFQRQDRMDMVAGSLALRGITSTVVFALVLVNGAGVVAAFAAQMAVWVAMALLVDLRKARRLSHDTGDAAPATLGQMRALGRVSLFLGYNGLLAALQSNMPRYVITNALGVVALGYFTVVGYALQAISTLVSAVTSSLVARLSHYLETNDSYALRTTVLKLVAGLAFLFAVGIAITLPLGDWLLGALFGTPYAHLGWLLTIILVAAALEGVAQVLETVLISARAFRRIVAIRIGVATAMFAGCVSGAALGGLGGVAWGICAAFAANIALLLYALRTLNARPAA